MEDEETILEDWEIFSNETSQLEYDELFHSVSSNSPDEHNKYNELITYTDINSSQSYIHDQQLLFEGTNISYLHILTKNETGL